MLDETERTDEAVAEKLAHIANKCWLQRLSDEKLKEKLEKCPRPINCNKIVVPKVNPEIWGKLSRQAKGNDLQSALSVAQPTEQLCEEHVQQFEHSHKELESISTREIDTSIISKLQSIEVSEYQSFLPSLLAFFRFRVSTFQAGQISHCVQQWRTLTSDSEILETVLGQRSGFTLTPVQVTPPPQPTWSKTEEEFIDMEIHAKAAPRGGDCTLSA